MSPNINSFVGDLVAMAKAMEDLPLVQAQVDQLTLQRDELAQTVQERELSIIDFKAKIEELQSKVRSLEVERDEASFRVLEAEDRAASVLRFVRSAMDQLDQGAVVLDPPKPAEMTPQVPVQDIGPDAAVSPVYPDTTPAPRDTGEYVPAVPAQDDGASLSSILPSSTPTETPDRPYSGRLYRDVTGYVSLDNWLAGGGTYDNYYA